MRAHRIAGCWPVAACLLGLLAWAAAPAVVVRAGAAEATAGARSPDAPGEGAGARLLALDAAREGALLRVDLAFDRVTGVVPFLIDAPPRLVIDYASSDGRPPARTGAMPEGLGPPRSGLFRTDRARVVIPLGLPMTVLRVATRRDGGGAVVSLTLAPADAAAFARAAGWPEGARWQGAGTPLPVPKPAAPGILVAIDPGHGGIDPGATVDGLTEKALVLEFSRRLAAAIERMAGVRTMLTREADVFVPLGERVRRAQRAGADLFLSIHADIVTAGDAEGMSLYTLAPEATDRAARELAERENRADLLAGVALEDAEDDVARLLVELSQRDTMGETDRLADAVMEALAGRVEILKSRPRRGADFRVLRAPDMPSLLVELGFLTNETDRARIVSPEWQLRAAEAVARGVASWIRLGGLDRDGAGPDGAGQGGAGQGTGPRG